MNYDGHRPKSFIYSFTWVGIFLLSMGLLFLGIAVILQFAPLDPAEITVYRNGIRLPATEDTVREFRLIAGLIFGGLGAIMAVIGICLTGHMLSKRRKARRLVEEGVCVIAKATDYGMTAVRTNRKYMGRLHCAYTDKYNVAYIFKSQSLRMDPRPYLLEEKVTVYYDDADMKHYFVDVDGSIGLGERVIEL